MSDNEKKILEQAAKVAEAYRAAENLAAETVELRRTFDAKMQELAKHSKQLSAEQIALENLVNAVKNPGLQAVP